MRSTNVLHLVVTHAFGNAACIDVWIHVYHVTTSPLDNIIIAAFNAPSSTARYSMSLCVPEATGTNWQNEGNINSIWYHTAKIEVQYVLSDNI